MTDWGHVVGLVGLTLLGAYFILGAVCTIRDMRRRPDEE